MINKRLLAQAAKDIVNEVATGLNLSAADITVIFAATEEVQEKLASKPLVTQCGKKGHKNGNVFTAATRSSALGTAAVCLEKVLFPLAGDDLKKASMHLAKPKKGGKLPNAWKKAAQDARSLWRAATK